MLLILQEGKYTVATSAWTASCDGDCLDIAYVWGAGDISLFQSATGVHRVQFDMTMDQFLALRRGNVIDVR